MPFYYLLDTEVESSVSSLIYVYIPYYYYSISRPLPIYHESIEKKGRGGDQQGKNQATKSGLIFSSPYPPFPSASINASFSNRSNFSIWNFLLADRYTTDVLLAGEKEVFSCPCSSCTIVVGFHPLIFEILANTFPTPSYSNVPPLPPYNHCHINRIRNTTCPNTRLLFLAPPIKPRTSGPPYVLCGITKTTTPLLLHNLLNSPTSLIKSTLYHNGGRPSTLKRCRFDSFCSRW